MNVLLYRGRSAVSWMIRKQTRSVYSHAAIQLDDGRVVEAWAGVGVRLIPYPFYDHTEDTEVDVYDFDNNLINVAAVEEYLKDQVGKKYDWASVFRFVSRRQAPANDKWFCSELVVQALRIGGLSILTGLPSLFSPRDVGMSPLITYRETI